jgi:type II secretory pathway component PulJ
MKRRRGFSLVENMLATGLFSLVTLLAVQLFTPCLKIFKQDQGQARLDETALVTSRTIEREVKPSTINSLTTSSQAFSFLEGESFDPTSGNPIWQNFVVYYFQNGKLWRKVWTPVGFPTMQSARLSAAQLAVAVATVTGTEHVVTQSVQSVTIASSQTLQVAATLAEPGFTSSFAIQVRPRR